MTVTRICLWLAVVVSGLALRRYGFGLGLPALVVKYGGSMLWGTMVFFMVASAASRLSRPNIALISGGIALCVELFRLVHAPWLDAFRLTLPGASFVRPRRCATGLRPMALPGRAAAAALPPSAAAIISMFRWPAHGRTVP